MKKFAAVLVLLYVLLATGFGAYAAAQEQRVYDHAGLFTDEQRSLLEQKITVLRENTGMDAVVVTTDNAGGKSAMEYADDYYDYNGFGTGVDYSGVLFLVDMDNREAYISTCGKMIDYLTDARIEAVLDKAYNKLTGGDYYAAANIALEQIGVYYDSGVPKGQYRQDEYGNITRYRSITASEVIVCALIALAVGIGGIVAVYVKYQKPATVYKYPFKQKSALRLTGQEDVFVNRIVTQHRIETSSSSGSGGGRSSTHRSSSGRSHGGGGRKF